jgi:hypothetical protein
MFELLKNKRTYICLLSVVQALGCPVDYLPTKNIFTLPSEMDRVDLLDHRQNLHVPFQCSTVPTADHDSLCL